MSERKDQELTIITKARDLVDETMSRTKKFDKRLRFTLSNRIDEKALDVLEAIVEANEINPPSKPTRSGAPNCAWCASTCKRLH